MSENQLYDDAGFDDIYDKIETSEDDKLDRAARSRPKSSGGSQRSRSRAKRSSSAKPKRGTSRSKSRARNKRNNGEGDSSKAPASSAGSVNQNEDHSEQGASEQGGEKRKKTKLEKIEQLQAKNALYKEEFKRVQKDRKQLKKDLEVKKSETEAMGKEIDEHVAEISRLKNQLSQALQRGGGEGGSDASKEEVDLLRQQNAKAKSEIDNLAHQIQNHNRDMEALNTTIREKEVEISQLQEEAGELRKEIRETASENRKLVSVSAESADLAKQMTALEMENERLENELKETVEKASDMVKEREEAIADLLKENEDFKNEIARYENKKALEGGGEDEEEDPQIVQLRQELVAVGTQMEESQDRNVILEEEVESWVARGAEMEKEIARLREEVGELTEKLETAEENVEAAESRAERAMEAAHAADDALEEAEEEFEQAMAEQAAKHKAALLDVKTRYAEERDAAAAGNGEKEVDQQAMLLQKAVATRKPDATRRNTWFSFGNAESAAAAAGEEDVPEDEKIAKIRELGELVDSKDEEIKQLKSELVQVRSTFNDTVYNNKKTMERLTFENETYGARVQELEKQLAEAVNAAAES